MKTSHLKHQIENDTPGCFRAMGWSSLLAVGLFAMTVAGFAAPATPAKPNILFILADDWGWGDLGCHGHPYVKTPHLDRLAAQGTDFQRFSVASGVCSPSRTAIMTGQFPARYRIDGHFAWVEQNQKRNMPDWLSTNAPSLPRFLQQAGYATAHYGKWHLANDMIPDSPLPRAYGYDDYAAFNCAGEQMPVHEDAKHAIAFIEKCHAQGKPFFINLWIHEPHTPFHVVPKYRQRFPGLPEADNIYAAVLSHADDRIGEVLDTLDRLKLADNTLVIFTSDNGPARAAKPTPLELSYDTATGAGYEIGASKGITGGRKGYKAALFEGGIGVPFLARWPGKIAAGKVDNQSLISAVDLLPTFCEAAGVKLPASYQPDGVSQLATFGGRVYPSRTKPLFWKFDSHWPPPANAPYHWASYVVEDQAWKLLVNKDGSHCELYDLEADPLEVNDLSKSKPEVVGQLSAKLKDWQATLPATPDTNCYSSLRAKP